MRTGRMSGGTERFKAAVLSTLLITSLVAFLVATPAGPLEASPTVQAVSNPSFELPAGEVEPESWDKVFVGLETSPYFTAFLKESLSSAYPPDSGVIPDGDWCTELFYQTGTFDGVGGLGGEQTSSYFSTTVDQTKQWTLSYYVEEDYFASPTNVRWAGGVAEIEFTSAASTYKLRYYHQCSATYESTPSDSETVKYVIGDQMISGDWIQAFHSLNEDINAKFGFDEFTVDAIRIEDLQDQKGGGYGNMTTYWDNVALTEGVPPPEVGVDISPEENGGQPGENATFTVTITNETGAGDTFDLGAVDTEGWPLSLPGAVGPIPDGSSADVSLKVTIPGSAKVGDFTIITVTATSQANNTVSGSDNCKASCYFALLEHYKQLPSDDAPVDEKYPDTPHGNEIKLMVGQHHTTPDLERSFLKFDISSIPPGALIVSARLKLYHHFGVYDGGPEITVELRKVGDDGWSEDVITWNNQPAMGDLLYSEVVYDWMDEMWLDHLDNGVDVKSYIVSELAGGYASFGLISPDAAGTGQDVEFSSKETTYGDHQKPYLEVWYYPEVPERWVDVSIPRRSTQAGGLGETLDYTVTVTNCGTNEDSYNLEASDTAGWAPTLDYYLLSNVSSEESRTVTLSVTIPTNAGPGTVNTITVTATSQGDDRVSESEEAIAAAPGEWVPVSNSPFIKDYAVGVAGAGENIYILNSNNYQNRYFMCYNTAADEWKYLVPPPDNVKNAVAMAWDNGNYIYILNGASYGTDAFFFYRYDIGGGSWEKLQDTPHTQGAGDAMCWVPESALGVGDDNYLYAIVGKNGSGSKFYRYSVKNSLWSPELNLPWSSTDDGCSLVWAGGSYLYALRGEWDETSACYDFARYDLTTNSWTSMAPIPADPYDDGIGGVGDGGSMLWIGGVYDDYIYALSGNQAYPEPNYDNRSYRYTISANSWERLADLPAGIGTKNGPRLGFASGSTGKIYCWRGCKGDPVLWVYAPEIPSLWTGTATFSMLNLYTVNVDMTLDIYQGSKLVVKFYSWGDAYEGENVIETFSSPWHVEESENARHPGGTGVMKARLVLTTDDTGNELLPTIASITVCKLDLAIRFSEIPAEWLLAQTPEAKLALAIEFSEVPAYWLLAPSC